MTRMTENENRSSACGDNSTIEVNHAITSIANGPAEEKDQGTAMSTLPLVSSCQQGSSYVEGVEENEDDFEKMNNKQLSSGYQESKDMKDAKILQLERNLEIILDENNLLHLELQDVQTTASTTVAGLERDLASMEIKCIELESRLRQIQEVSKALYGKLAADVLDEIKDEIIKIEKLCLMSASDTKTSGKGTIPIPNIISCNEKTEQVSHLGVPSPDFAENLEVKENKDGIEENATNESTAAQVTIEEAKLEQTVSKPLRRSQRKSITKRQLEIAATPKPDKPVTKTLIKEDPSSSKKVTPSPPQLKREDYETGSINHAVDTTQPHGFNCVCGRQYLTKQKLDVHIRQFTSEWKFICKTCGVKYFEAFKLKKHMRRVHGQQALESHGCYYCGEIFENRRELFMHQRITHDCGPFKKKKRKTAVVSNSSGVKMKEVNPKNCRTSNAREQQQGQTRKSRLAGVNNGKTGTALPKSKSSVLNVKKNPVKSFEDERSSSIHKIDDSKDGYFCKCGTTFTSRNGLSVHIKYFTYEAKFACSHCERKFFSTCLLRAHMKAKHNVLFTGTDGCRRCGRCFPSRLKLYQHCKTAHKCGPLMVNMKKRTKKIRSPDPEPPKLEREDGAPDAVSHSAPGEADATAKANLIGETSQKSCTITRSSSTKSKSFAVKAIATQGVVNSVETLMNNFKEEADLEESEAKTGNHNGELAKMEMDTAEISEVSVELQNTSQPNELFSKKRKRSPSEYAITNQATPCISDTNKPLSFKRGRGRPRLLKNSKVTSQKAKNTEKTRKVKNVCHKATKSTQKGTEVKCTCGITFAKKAALYSHIRLKTTRDNFKCCYCSEGFPRRDYLRRHQKIMHGKDSSEPKPNNEDINGQKNGSVADAETKNLNNLLAADVKNQEVVHGVVKTETEFKCLCGRQFVREVTLHEHLRLKIGKRVFKCDLCPESFSRHDYFKDHLKRIHDLTYEGMACRDCGARGFLSHKELRSHRSEFHSSAKISESGQL